MISLGLFSYKYHVKDSIEYKLSYNKNVAIKGSIHERKS
jgi:hypothetical protein